MYRGKHMSNTVDFDKLNNLVFDVEKAIDDLYSSLTIPEDVKNVVKIHHSVGLMKQVLLTGEHETADDNIMTQDAISKRSQFSGVAKEFFELVANNRDRNYLVEKEVTYFYFKFKDIFKDKFNNLRLLVLCIVWQYYYEQIKEHDSFKSCKSFLVNELMHGDQLYAIVSNVVGTCKKIVVTQEDIIDINNGKEPKDQKESVILLTKMMLELV